MTNPTPINRCIDELGRIVIPIEWRQQLGINPKDELSIRCVGRKLTIEKAQPQRCASCGGVA